MLWYILLMLILYIMCSFSMVFVVVIFLMNFDYIVFMMFESYTILFLYLVLSEGSSYERSGANIYLLVFGYIIGFGVVICNNLVMMSIILLILGLANLPMFSLHMWLPNVHVEASILGSMILASGVLKLGIIYCWNFGLVIVVSVIVIITLFWIMSIVDGKSFAAYSSVLHITCCVIVSLVIMLVIGYMHIVLSPLIFISIYITYNISGSRYYMNLGIIIIILWIVNFGLPFVSGFFAEVYFIIYNSYILLILLIMYMVCGYIIIKSLNDVSMMNFYIPWLVLYLLIV